MTRFSAIARLLWAVLLVLSDTTRYVNAGKGKKSKSGKGVRCSMAYTGKYQGGNQYHIDPHELSAMATHCGSDDDSDDDDGSSIPAVDQAPTSSSGSQPPVASAATNAPTVTPSLAPITSSPTAKPTPEPTNRPTANPTPVPTESPTEKPTLVPTDSPTAKPSHEPTDNPTAMPTSEPSDSPTASPTSEPTKRPTAVPTFLPTTKPTEILSAATPAPSLAPSSNPSKNPTSWPSLGPSKAPTGSPTIFSGCPGFSIEGRRNALRDVVSGVSGGDLLNDETSPQALAFKWLADDDGLGLCPGDTHVAQRYALAVFYFSLTGDEWWTCTRDGNTPCQGEHFLSDRHECLWGGLACGPGRRLLNINLGTLPESLDS